MVESLKIIMWLVVHCFSVHIFMNWNFLVKRHNYSWLQNFLPHPPGCYTGKMLFANASKTITNWFLTLQPDIFKIICNLPNWHRIELRRNISTWRYVIYQLIYSLIYLCTMCERKKSVIKIPTLILYLKL